MKNSFINIFGNNRVVFFISLFLAIALWGVVSPNRTIIIKKNVVLDTKNTPAQSIGLEIVEGKEQEINVEIKGKWYIISALTDADININYSLDSVTQSGSYDVAISASKANNKDFTITSVTPDSVNIGLDFISQKDFTIEVVTNNPKAQEGYIVGKPVLPADKNIINISGPSSIVHEISSVVAEVEIKEELSEAATYQSILKFYDSSGKEVDTSLCTLPFKRVQVTVPINKSKLVPIKVEFKNQPAYYVVAPLDYKISVQQVKIIGVAESIDKIEDIKLGPIDFASINEDNNVFKFDLNLQTGLSLVDDINKVKVTIDVSGLKSKTLEVSKFVGINGSNKINSSVITSNKTVKVVGPASVIDKISSSDIYLQYDLSNATNATGEMVVNAILKSNKYNNVWGFGEYQIQIKVF